MRLRRLIGQQRHAEAVEERQRQGAAEQLEGIAAGKRAALRGGTTHYRGLLHYERSEHRYLYTPGRVPKQEADDADEKASASFRPRRHGGTQYTDERGAAVDWTPRKKS